jgi:hypothetical protein
VPGPVLQFRDRCLPVVSGELPPRRGRARPVALFIAVIAVIADGSGEVPGKPGDLLVEGLC